jgi:hypothetical protein
MYDDEFECDKFDECYGCKFRFREDICGGCGLGEEYEPDDLEEVDAHFVGRN